MLCTVATSHYNKNSKTLTQIIMHIYLPVAVVPLSITCTITSVDNGLLRFKVSSTVVIFSITA